ncbi:MAG TPA: ABC transporter substrate-binding protein, partial [Cyanobacteria bacterium UBA9226]|nr:ABC transporter substrate-binding protein [Cyanobacteria bacterium UBA9226]
TAKKNVAVMNLVIPGNTEQPENALKFALFVTNSTNQLAFAKEANVLPSTIDSVEKYKNELSSNPQASTVEKGRSIGANQLTDA